MTLLTRRQILKYTAASAASLSAPFSPKLIAQETRGIEGHEAPELEVSEWIDEKGGATTPFSIAEHKGKWIYLKCFQEWCPSCHSIGFPNLQKLVAAFPDNNIIVPAVIQTTFEGFSSNTVDALRKNQLRYNLSIPFGHDPGNENLPASNIKHYPSTMTNYRTGGTPWVVLINPDGVVVFNGFHINIDKLISFLKSNPLT